MKKLSILLCVLLVLAGFAGCSAQAAPPQNGDGDADRLSVVTTIFPQYDFVREITGSEDGLTLLLTPGAESHSYDPSPQDIITIQNCDVFIYVGGGNDVWVERILESMDTGNMRLVALTDLVSALPEEFVEGMEHNHEDEEDHDHDEDEAHDDHDHDEEATLDEHVWTSPVNAMAIVQGISAVLCDADPAGAELYTANASAYIEKLEALDAQFREVVAGAARNTIVVGDRFPFRYLVEEYGINYYAALSGCSSSTSCSPATIAFLIDTIRDEELPVVFHIEMSNQQTAAAICESTNAQTLLLHSCHNLTRDELAAGEGYLSLMAQNVENLKAALW